MCIKILLPRMLFYTHVLFFICIDEECTQFWASVPLYEGFMMRKKPYSSLVWWHIPAIQAPRRMDRRVMSLTPACATDDTRFKETKDWG